MAGNRFPLCWTSCGARRSSRGARLRALSKFYVGARFFLEDGAVFTGCNVENVSYGLTSCAERNALFRAISEGEQGRKIRVIAVANRNGAAEPRPAARAGR